MDIEAQLRVINENAVEVLPPDELAAKLERGPLRVKLGLDPTAEHVTLGWAVVLRKLRAFQDLGHTAVLIVGDFTARIGDPSGQDRTRPMLSKSEVDAYAERLLGQFELILDADRLEVRRNAEWLEDMDMAGLLRLASHYTVAQMLQRDDFADRFAAGSPISIREFLYPLLQAYDSVAVRADVELGGTDQHFNLMVGRHVQRAYDLEPQVVVTMPLLEGTDGVRKMSQSLGNYIGVTEAPDDMFGKLMRVPDDLLGKYLRLVSGLSDGEASELVDAVAAGTVRPEEAKRRLAAAVVGLYHGPDAAGAARARFDLLFKEHVLPSDVAEVDLPAECVDDGKVHLAKLLKVLGLAGSTTEGRRLIRQGGVSVDGEVVTEEYVGPDGLRGRILRVGKRRFARVR